MQITSGTSVNGAIITCLETIRVLLKRGHAVTLVCRPNAWIADQFERGEIQVVYSDLYRWPTDELRRIAGLVCERQIEVVHTHMSRAHFFGVLLRRLFKIPCVATANCRHFQLHWMFNDRVIAASQANKRYQNQVNWVRKHRIDVIHNFVHSEDFDSLPPNTRQRVRSELGLSANEFAIGQIGAVVPRKGLLYMVRAMPGILRHNPSARLVVVGGEEEAYAAAVRAESVDLNVDKSILWTGHRGDMPRILSALDLCVLPTLEDSLPLAILEAMASRLAVVSTRVGGIPECVVDGETGHLVAPGKVDPLSERIVRLMQDSDLRNRLGQAGHRRIKRHFSAQSQSALLEQTLGRVAAKRGRAA